ncbi:ORF2 [Bovine adenovirus 3]|uniref:Uncharacterized protein n=1 Tax=Bovine adenovirus B serotype 3 TaxID=10510 RepID=A0A9W3N285_ADEB3|nr:hypothetical protein BAdVBgp28 [Bovine adenovirus 3]AP_000043.1 E4 ORFB [Bovine mastadenovirus B]AAD09740.1 ORF2 [Bovine adenovirus 3]
MAQIVYSSLFVFHVPGPVLSYVQSFYAEDICPATIELLQRCLEINLTAIPTCFAVVSEPVCYQLLSLKS